MDFEDYIAHLREDGMCDSLELYLVLAVLEHPINLIQESDVWLTSKDGIDFQHPIVMITGYGRGVCCVIDASDAEVEPIAGIPVTLPAGHKKKGGRPILETVLIHGPDSTSTIGAESSSHIDTDIEHMMGLPHC